MHVQVRKSADLSHSRSRKIRVPIRGGTLADIARQLGMQPNELPIPKCLGQPETAIASKVGLLEGSAVTFEDLETVEQQPKPEPQPLEQGSRDDYEGATAYTVQVITTQRREQGAKDKIRVDRDHLGVGGVLFEPPAEFGTDLLPAEVNPDDRAHVQALASWRARIGEAAMLLTYKATRARRNATVDPYNPMGGNATQQPDQP